MRVVSHLSVRRHPFAHPRLLCARPNGGANRGGAEGPHPGERPQRFFTELDQVRV
jgi:hypothetical protein